MSPEFYPCTVCGEEAADAPGALCLPCFDDEFAEDDSLSSPHREGT